MFNRPAHPVTPDDDAESPQMRTMQEQWAALMMLQDDRKQQYKTYDEMDKFGLVAGILDVYAEEATQPDYDKRMSVWVESKLKHLVSAGHECLRNVQMEDKIANITRRMCKYGDAWQRTIYQTGKGVLGWKHVPAKQMQRIEDKYSRLIGFRQDGQKFKRGSKERNVSWPWDYIHFRLLGRSEDGLYGTSILENLYRPWRQLTLAEDSMLMYRIRRAPDRNMILVDVGDLPDTEAMEVVNTWRKKFRKYEFVDPASPNYKKQYNPFTPLEDIFLPMRRDQNTRVETLSGSANVGEVYDIEYLRNKFFGSAKVNKAYFGFEGEINAKATLMQQDVRFARTAKRIQRADIYAIRTLLMIHYNLMPTSPEDSKWDVKDEDFIVQMSPIAYLDEWERLELIQLRYQIIESMSRLAMDMKLDAKVWAIYLLLNYAKLPEDLVLKLTSKIPEAGAGGGMGFEALRTLDPNLYDAMKDMDPKTRDVICEGMTPVGFYELNEAEKMNIAKLMHESAPLRKVIGDISWFHEDDIERAAASQIDWSWLPPTVNGQMFADSYEDDAEAKALNEDLDEVKATLTEDDEAAGEQESDDALED
jgi:hypothetical protein